MTFPAHLILNGREVEVPTPKCLIGETVYMVEQDVHPIDQLDTVVTGMCLRQDPSYPTDLVWGYLVKSDNFIKNREYADIEIHTEKEHLEALHQAINDRV